jgi:hypothetical protein
MAKFIDFNGRMGIDSLHMRAIVRHCNGGLILAEIFSRRAKTGYQNGAIFEISNLGK